MGKNGKVFSIKEGEEDKYITLKEVNWKEVIRTVEGNGTVTLKLRFPDGLYNSRVDISPINVLCSDCKTMQKHYAITVLNSPIGTFLHKIICPKTWR